MFANTSILCAVDLSEGSTKVVDAATDLASKLGCKLTVLHAFDHPLYNMPTGFSPPTGYAAALMDADKEVKAQLDKLLTETTDRIRSQGIDVTAKVAEGPAAQVINDEAEAGNHSLVILGTHGYSGFKRFLLGSVAERVVRTANMPVMTVPTHDEAKSKA